MIGAACTVDNGNRNRQSSIPIANRALSIANRQSQHRRSAVGHRQFARTTVIAPTDRHKGRAFF
jgi:hypothetical protein